MTIFGHDHTMSSRQFPPGTMVDKWLKYGGILVDPPNIYQISTTVPAGFIPFCSMISYNSLHLYYKWDHHLFFIIIWWNFNFKSYFLFHSHVIFQHWMIEFRYWCQVLMCISVNKAWWYSYNTQSLKVVPMLFLFKSLIC